MRMRQVVFGGILALGVCSTVYLSAQDPADEVRISTMRPIVRGRTQAAASMKAEATRAADRILQAGGNAFDAAVAGQAVLGIVDAASNGVGSDAVILRDDAKAKTVVSINAEGTAPRLATIEWYQKNLGGKLPQSDTLLSGTVPGVVDAWYTLLDRWGTMTFAQVLQPAIDTAENGFPIGERMAAAIAGSRKLKKYPTSVKVYFPGGAAPRPGDIFRNPDLARTLRKLVDAEKENAGRGRHEALKAARDRFYKGDIARTMAKFSEEQGGLFRYEDFASYTDKIETPVSIDYRGYRVYKNASANQGPTELFALNILEGYDLKKLGHNSADYIHTGIGTGVVMADLGFIFNCRGDYYSLVAGEANALAPGKRPRSTLQSTLVMKSNQPFMIVGSPGGDDQVFRTIQTLLNVVDFGMNVQEAIEAPRWATRSFPASPFPHTMYPGEMSVEQRVPEAVREALIKRGHKLRVGGPWTMGSLAAIVVDPKTGVLNAGTDPRVDAYAIAW